MDEVEYAAEQDAQDEEKLAKKYRRFIEEKRLIEGGEDERIEKALVSLLAIALSSFFALAAIFIFSVCGLFTEEYRLFHSLSTVTSLFSIFVIVVLMRRK